MDRDLDPQRLERYLPELLQQYVPDQDAPAPCDATPAAAVPHAA